MRLGMIGLGRMGLNMARRLLRGGHEIVAFNRTPDKTELAVVEGAEGALSLDELVRKLDPPRTVWLMLPAGPVVDQHLEDLGRILSPGDLIIDGGNSNYRDSVRRSAAMAASGLDFLDAGVSGGVWGLEEGYCLMIGGPAESFHRLEPVFRTLAPAQGYLHCGPAGSGHFVKMIHNGIEYGLMQAYAEGFDLLQASTYGPGLNLADLARLWNHGSVIRSWLLELAGNAFSLDPGLESLKAYVEDSGEGRWAVNEALDLAVPAPVITLALMERFRSRRPDSFADRVLAALRREFGGHAVRETNNDPNESR